MRLIIPYFLTNDLLLRPLKAIFMIFCHFAWPIFFAQECITATGAVSLATKLIGGCSNSKAINPNTPVLPFFLVMLVFQ